MNFNLTQEKKIKQFILFQLISTHTTIFLNLFSCFATSDNSCRHNCGETNADVTFSTICTVLVSEPDHHCLTDAGS